jgi:hypothetical protein
MVISGFVIQHTVYFNLKRDVLDCRWCSIFESDEDILFIHTL